MSEPVVCRMCGGYGFIAQKQCIDDGYGEVDSCPACDERDEAIAKEREAEGWVRSADGQWSRKEQAS